MKWEIQNGQEKANPGQNIKLPVENMNAEQFQEARVTIRENPDVITVVDRFHKTTTHEELKQKRTVILEP